jgi:hypothetical protein
MRSRSGSEDELGGEMEAADQRPPETSVMRKKMKEEERKFDL